MPVPLLATKLYIPPARDDAVSRPRLVEKLMAGVARPGSLTLLSGPAGFGKTTLLSEFVARLRRPVGWLSLDEGDNDPVRFWSYLIAACQAVQPGVGASVQAVLQSPQSLPEGTIPTLLLNDIAHLDGELVLVLDDYHAIQNLAIHTGLLFLLEHQPVGLHLLVATRSDPPWPLARFRARNRLVEMRAQDLRFTKEEATLFLSQVMRIDLSAENIAALEAHTEGWVAGLQLAAIAMTSLATEPPVMKTPPSIQENEALDEFVKAFTGSHIYIAEYLLEEVLQRQPAEVQAFLLNTSILDRLCAPLCAAVLDIGRKPEDEGYSSFVFRPAAELLEEIRRANLFIVSLDAEHRWFRYHQLFAELLQARLRQELPASAIAALHQRAAAWYEQAGMIPEAIEHALAAGDEVRGVQLIEQFALPMILQGYVGTVEGWLRAIPPKTFDRRPRVHMAYAWMNLLRGSLAQAAPSLSRLESLFSTPSPDLQDPSLQGEWLAIQSQLLRVQGRPAESRDLAERALQILPETESSVRSLLRVNLASAYEQMLDYELAAETFQMIVQDARAAGDPVFETLGLSGHARMALVQGRLHLAFKLASEGIQRVESSGVQTPFSATFYGELSQIHYHWHQLDRFRFYSTHSIQASGKSGYSDPEIYHHILLSKISQMEGDWDAAAGEMQQADDLAARVPPAMIRENIIAQRVRVELAFGRIPAARALLEGEGYTFGDPPIFPDLAGADLPRPVSLLSNAALRVLFAQAGVDPDRPGMARGVELAGPVLAGELQQRLIPSAIETLVIRSQMHARLGDGRESLADLTRALELAQPEGLISVFIEEGPPIAEALRRLLKRGLSGPVRPDTVDDILAAFPAAGPSQAERPDAVTDTVAVGDEAAARGTAALVEPLTRREQEVLALIAAGCSNRAIAEKLVITVSAVKKHTGNIYGKLNVNSRTQAVAFARQLGLLTTGG